MDNMQRNIFLDKMKLNNIQSLFSHRIFLNFPSSLHTRPCATNCPVTQCIAMLDSIAVPLFSNPNYSKTSKLV